MKVLLNFSIAEQNGEKAFLVLSKTSDPNAYSLHTVPGKKLHSLPRETVRKTNEIARILAQKETEIDGTVTQLEFVTEKINHAAKVHNHRRVRQIFKALLPKFIFDLLRRLPCLIKYDNIAVEQLKDKLTYADSVNSPMPASEEAGVAKSTKAQQPAHASPSTDKLTPKTVFAKELGHFAMENLLSPQLPHSVYKQLSTQNPEISYRTTKAGNLLLMLPKSWLPNEDWKLLLPRLEFNHRYVCQEEDDHYLIDIPNHYLLQFFDEKQSLLQSLYKENPSLKEMHAYLLEDHDFEKLVCNLEQPMAYNLLANEGKPGDYLIIPDGKAHLFVYMDVDLELKTFKFTYTQQTFSSYAHFQKLKRPLLYKHASPEEQTNRHNQLLYFKNIKLIEKLEQFSCSGISSTLLSGVDAPLHLEDLIIWHDHLPDTDVRKNKKLFQPICTLFSEIFGHYFGLKGTAYSKEKKINIEGMHRPIAKAQVAESILRQLPTAQSVKTQHLDKLKSMASKSTFYSNNSKSSMVSNLATYQKNGAILDDLAQGIPVSFTTGWAGHSVEISLYAQGGVTYLAYANRGMSLNPEETIAIYQVKNELTNEIIGHLRSPPAMKLPIMRTRITGEKQVEEMELGAYFSAPAPVLEQLGQYYLKKHGKPRPPTMQEELGLELVGSIKKAKQKVGNCTVANGKCSLFNTALLLEYADQLQTGNQHSFNLSNEYALKLYKEVNFSERAYLMKTWRRFTKYFTEEENQVAKMHFELFQKVTSKFLKQKDKCEKYKTNPLYEGTTINKSIEQLNYWMENYVSACPYDIEVCASSIPFYSGSTVNKGPIGSFGIYKAGKNEFRFVVKNAPESSKIYPIKSLDATPENPLKYSMEIDGHKFAFTTLGRLAGKMNHDKIKMIYSME